MSNNQNVQQTEKKFNETFDKVSAQAQEELARVKAEFEEFKRKSQPKVQEAESFLTSPSAIGFYQGLLVGVVVVLGYARYKGGLVV